MNSHPTCMKCEQRNNSDRRLEVLGTILCSSGLNALEIVEPKKAKN